MAQRPEAEQLQVITEVTEHKEVDAVNSAEAQPLNGHDMQVLGNKTSPANGVNGTNGVNGEAEAFKAGDIVVTWKDGNVSNLYSDSAAEPQEEEQTEQKVEEEQEEVVVESAAETDAQVGAE